MCNISGARDAAYKSTAAGCASAVLVVIRRHIVKKQAGYLSMDFRGMFVALIILGAVIGMAVTVAVPWLWGLVRPWLHSITG